MTAWLVPGDKKNESYPLRRRKSSAKVNRSHRSHQMSVQAITWAFKQHVGKPSAKLVLINLADHADQDRKCWPSLRTIAARTELSRDTVIRSMRLLELKGLITVKHRREGRVSR